MFLNLFSWLVDEGSEVTRPKAVVNVDHADTGGAAIEHGEEGSQPAEAGTVAHAGGNGDYRRRHQSTDDAGEGAFHASDRHYDLRLVQSWEVVEQAMQPGDAHIVDSIDCVAHQLGNERCLLSHWEVGGAPTHHQYPGMGWGLLQLIDDNRAGGGLVGRLGHFLLDGGEAFLSDAGYQNPVALSAQSLHQGNHLLHRLALPEDNLRKAFAKRSVVIELGEAQILVGQDAKFGKSLFYGYLPRLDL